MATNSLKMSFISKGDTAAWETIRNGWKCFKFTLPMAIGLMDISSFTFAWQRTSDYSSDNIYIDFWITAEEVSAESYSDIVANPAITRKTYSTASGADKTMSVDLTSGLLEFREANKKATDFYILQVMSDVASSSQTRKINSSYMSKSSISYEVIRRDYSPTILSATVVPQTLIVGTDGNFDEDITVRVQHNGRKIDDEDYWHGVIFRVYINDILNISRTVEIPYEETVQDVYQRDVQLLFTMPYDRTVYYRFTTELVISNDREGSEWSETSGEVEVLSYAPASVPFNLARSNRAIGIGMYASRTENDVVDIGWKMRVRGGLVDGDDNPIGGSGFKLDCGRIAAQGNVSSGSYRDTVIEFNVEYTEPPLVMTCFESGSTAGTFGRCNVSVVSSSVTTTGCTLRFYNGDSSARNPALIWYAMGN